MKLYRHYQQLGMMIVVIYVCRYSNRRCNSVGVPCTVLNLFSIKINYDEKSSRYDSTAKCKVIRANNTPSI